MEYFVSALSSLLFMLSLVLTQGVAQAQDLTRWQANLTQPQSYVLKRVSSPDPTGGNADFRFIGPGATLTVLDADGPAELTHIWFTVYDPEPYHLKRLVLRMYWDGESSPSVEAPLGDFFGLGLGDYHVWESELLSVANERDRKSTRLNSSHLVISYAVFCLKKETIGLLTHDGLVDTVHRLHDLAEHDHDMI